MASDHVLPELTEANANGLREMLEKLAPVCERANVRRIKVGILEVEFGSTVKMDPAALAEFSKSFMASQPNDEEVLFHSAPDFVRPPANGAPAPGNRTSRRR